MGHQLRIQSYFALPTDLAKEMCLWPEFITGEGYNVELRSNDQNDVSIRFVASDEGYQSVIVRATIADALFERVVGKVIYALSAHSDALLVDRYVPSDARREKL